MRARKTVLLIVSFCVLFSSCGTLQEPPDISHEIPNGTEPEGTLQSPLPDVPTEYPKLDKTVVWAVPNLYPPCTDDMWLAAVNLALIERGADFNVEILPVGGPEEGYEEPDENGQWYLDYVALLMSEGRQIDLFYAGAGNGNGHILDWYMRAYQEDMAAPLDDLFQSETGGVLWDCFAPVFWDMMRINGKVYGLPTWFIAGSEGSYLITREWLNSNSLETSALTSDIDSLADAIGAADGVIVQCDVIYDGYFTSVPPMLGLTLAAPGVAITDKGAVAFFESEPLYAHLRSSWNLFEQGTVSWYSHSVRQPSDIIFGYEGIDAVFPLDQSEYASVIVTAPDMQSRREAICVANASRYKDECVRLLAWLHTDPEFADLFFFGVEGVHYRRENGKAYVIGGDDRFNYFYSNVYRSFIQSASLSFEFGLFDKDILNKDVLANAREYMSSLTPSAVTGFHFDSRGWEDTIANLDALLYDELTFFASVGEYETFLRVALFLTGEDPEWETKLARLNKTLSDAGIHELVAEADRQYKEWQKLYSLVR